MGSWGIGELGNWGAKFRRFGTFVQVSSNFRRLVAYQRAAELASELHTAVQRWPLLERKTIGEQLIRSATSVAANIAEASGRWHGPDRRQLLLIARGSLRETEHWIAYAETRGLLAPGTADRTEDIARPLSGLIRKTQTT